MSYTVFFVVSLIIILSHVIVFVDIFCYRSMSSTDAATGVTPLMHAAYLDDIEAVRELVIAKVNLAQCDQKGNNIAHYAARSGNIKLLEVNIAFDT